MPLTAVMPVGTEVRDGGYNEGEWKRNELIRRERSDYGSNGGGDDASGGRNADVDAIVGASDGDAGEIRVAFASIRSMRCDSRTRGCEFEDPSLSDLDGRRGVLFGSCSQGVFGRKGECR